MNVNGVDKWVFNIIKDLFCFWGYVWSFWMWGFDGEFNKEFIEKNSEEVIIVLLDNVYYVGEVR